MSKNPSEKPKLHPRNKNKSRYNFPKLIASHPILASHLSKNKENQNTINFFDPVAVKVFNQAILKHHYQIEHWDIPEGFLCPPIPGRADYIHYLADLLSEANQNKIPQGKKIIGLDIGVGANCIYPLIGNKEYNWSFVGSDISSVALKSAQQIIENNNLNSLIELREQPNSKNLFKNVIKENEHFDFVMCNPPFHASAEEAKLRANRKLKNLTGKRVENPKLNFGGTSNELWTEGGEKQFITDLIKESAQNKTASFYFTSLISKKSNVTVAQACLKEVDAKEIKVIEMGQGNKTSRFIAWSFLTSKQQNIWTTSRWK
jgi:23S rRNA (adenine1618-N6)-methyltransferase